MSDDVFTRHQKLIDKARELNRQFEKVPCDNMETYKIEDCKTCPSPCPDSDSKYAGDADE
jgi:hypothetical protein